MAQKTEIQIRIAKRLLPLYIAAFFQGFVFWYTIEKLFMREIGFTDATIGLMVAVYSALILIIETPSGVLADRWSRKGVLIIASVALILAALVGGISTGVTLYIISTLLWGIFYALYSGTYDSIVYDTVLEETKESTLFEYYYGKIKLMDSSALVLSALLGGVLANWLGLRWAYFLTIPFALLSIIALVKFTEPRLHKMEIAVPIKEHLSATFHAVARNKTLVPVLIVMILLTMLSESLFEFSQLWLIALATPIVWYGTANAALLATIGIGGSAASFLRLHRYPVTVFTVCIMIASALGLVFLRNTLTIVLCQVLLGASLIGLYVVFNRLLHDSLSSNIRAGAASAVSTMSRVCIVPFAIAFGYISNKADVFTASWLLVAFVIVAAFFILRIARQDGHTGLASKL